MDIHRAQRVWVADDTEMRTNPYPAYATLRAHGGPIHRVDDELGTRWYILDHDLARTVLTDPRIIRHAATLPTPIRPTDPLAALGLADSMLGVDPPGHTRLRRLVAAAFTPRRVEQLRPRIQHIADGLLDQMACHPQI